MLCISEHWVSGGKFMREYGEVLVGGVSLFIIVSLILSFAMTIPVYNDPLIFIILVVSFSSGMGAAIREIQISKNEDETQELMDDSRLSSSLLDNDSSADEPTSVEKQLKSFVSENEELTDLVSPIILTPELDISSTAMLYQKHVKNNVERAHEYYQAKGIEQFYALLALDIVIRYVRVEGNPIEEVVFYASALYIANRHPNSYPNPLTVGEFADKLQISKSALQEFTANITDRLNFFTVSDDSNNPYYIDPQDLVSKVISALVKQNVSRSVIKGITTSKVESIQEIVDRISNQLIEVVKIIPKVFQYDIERIITKKIRVESNRLLEEMGSRRMSDTP
jgi:hypothetical protein